MQSIRRISKSRLMSGLRCPKLLWLLMHKPQLATRSATAALAIDGGNAVGEIARTGYPGGKLVEHVEEPDLAIAETNHHLVSHSGSPLFEGAFEYLDVLVRADILVPVADGWRIVEAKSSARVKDHHLKDCAIQLWVLEGAGLNVREVCVAHVNRDFQYQGNGNHERLLVEEDVTERVRALLPRVPAWLASHKDTVSAATPSIRMSGQCKPDCPYQHHCEQDMPEYPVSMLPNGKGVIEELLQQGIEDVRDIPDGILKNKRHILVWQATKSNTPYISRKLAIELQRLAFPRFFLDFETINFVIPRWDGTRPHQQLPFQWSCHIDRNAGEVEHREFLDTTGNSPMRAFAESLIAAVEDDGPIVVYGSFEGTVIKTLIEFFPDIEGPLMRIRNRMVDLLPLLKNHYYHPAMKGSWSIKAILPTVAPQLDYARLDEVRNGTLAQLAYLKITDPDTDAATRAQTIRNLLRYCELDTQAMVEIVRGFSNS